MFPPLMADEGDLKSLATRWLLHQGVSTVLLFMILLGVGWAVHFEVPEHIRLLNGGMLEREQLRDQQIRSIKEAFERDQERDERRFQDLVHRRFVTPETHLP